MSGREQAVEKAAIAVIEKRWRNPLMVPEYLGERLRGDLAVAFDVWCGMLLNPQTIEATAKQMFEQADGRADIWASTADGWKESVRRDVQAVLVAVLSVVEARETLAAPASELVRDDADKA